MGFHKTQTVLELPILLPDSSVRAVSAISHYAVTFHLCNIFVLFFETGFFV